VTGKDKKESAWPFRGRPPRHEGERLSKNRTFRVRGGLDEKLRTAAAASGRSVREEIEFRLDQSFDRDGIINLVLGGDLNAKVLQTMAVAMKMVSRNGHWLKEASSKNRVSKAVKFIIEHFADYPLPLEEPGSLPRHLTPPELVAYWALDTVGAIHIVPGIPRLKIRVSPPSPGGMRALETMERGNERPHPRTISKSLRHRS
jgi:hypothetical protein